MKSTFLCSVLAFLWLGFTGNVCLGDESDMSLMTNDGMYRHPIMKPDHATFRKWIESYENAPKAIINERIMKKGFGTSVDLLGHVDYIPSERDQGTCGNCWVWAGTGVMEIAHSVQEGIKDRLSVQYVNSCYTTPDGYACCGGWLEDVATTYTAAGMTIPWSNTNASFQDGSKNCPLATSSDVSCGNIATSPSYAIPTIAYVTITTQGVSNATAIANIKNILNQNKGVWFGFFLPDTADWDVFYDFWNNDTENDLFDYDFSCGHTWVEGEGGGHAVLIVGYNDSAPQPYWIALNSWGTETGRPNGLFRIKMNMDYNCSQYDPAQGNYYALYFQTLNVDFTGGSSNTTTTSTFPMVNLTPYTPQNPFYSQVP